MIGALVLAASLLAQTTPSPSPSANDILFRALARLRSYGTPAYVVYLAEENGETHRIAFRGADEMMNDSILPTGTSLPPARVYRAFVGPLSYSVHEAIATPAAEATPRSQSPANLEATLKTIAVVSSHGHLYNVRVAGTEKIGDRDAYRISLSPVRDPDRNAIRDLWVDTSTYDVLRADYVYAHPPDVGLVGAEADLTVSFATVGHYRIAGRWIAIYHAPDLRTPVYRELRVVKMAFPASLPDWLFDQALYALHRHDGEADPLQGVFDGT